MLNFTKRALISLSIILFVTSCSIEETISSCPTSTIPITVYLDDFEDGSIYDKDRWWLEGTNYFSDDVETTTDLARSGDQSVRFFHRDPTTDGQGVKRAEINHHNFEPVCSEVYYAWSFYIDPTYVESGNKQIMGQWHGRPDEGAPPGGTSPPVSIRLNNKVLSLNVVEANGKLLHEASKNINFGVWIDLIFHIKWSLFSDGFVEAWIRDDTTGSKFLPLTPFNNSTSDYKMYAPNVYNAAGNFVKLGIYRPTGADTPATVYFDNFRIVTSFDEAASP